MTSHPFSKFATALSPHPPFPDVVSNVHRPGYWAEGGLCPRPLSMFSSRLAGSARPRAVTGGGSSRSLSSSASPHSWSTPTGRLSRAVLLFLGTVLLAFLLSRNLRRFAARLVWSQARLVAPVVAFFAGTPDPLGARPVPRHLLLLPRRVLQGLLGRPALLHRGRAAQDATSASIPSRSSCRTSTAIFCTCAVCHPRLPVLRRLESPLVRRSSDRARLVRHRPRHPGAGDQ